VPDITGNVLHTADQAVQQTGLLRCAVGGRGQHRSHDSSLRLHSFTRIGNKLPAGREVAGRRVAQDRTHVGRRPIASSPRGSLMLRTSVTPPL
jgi:hypothetical protein